MNSLTKNAVGTLTVKSLHIYPLKSAKGLSLSEIEVCETGPAFDRQWMVTEADGSFVSQRTAPEMSQVSTALVDETLKISAPGFSDLHVPKMSQNLTTKAVQVFEQPASGLLVSKEADQWFSDFLKRPAHLVQANPKDHRRSPLKYDPQETPVNFPDGFPFLLTSEESLADLNQKLASPISMEHFRPNIVIQGCDPFGEDLLTTFKISQIPFVNVKPCSRCVIVTIDPKTGKKNPQIMSKLIQYRKKGQKILFGINLSHQATGCIKVGDTLG